MMAQARRLLLLIVLVMMAGVRYAEADSFHDVSPGDLDGPPGSVIRTENLAGAPMGATAYRILYRSRGLDGEPIAVSGMVIIPAGPAPSAGYPIVAWAHPTSGLISRCAPSLARVRFRQIQGLELLLRQGYAVTATDYPGLGTPGPHPYLVGESEGRAVLDSVRAARHVLGSSENRFAAWGHSQGGQAVLYAASLARRYAPELDLVGIAAAAPATELGRLLRDDLPTSGGKNLLAMTLWSWAQVYHAPIDSIVDPQAVPVIDNLAQICLESIIDVLPRMEDGKQLQKRFLTVDDFTAMAPWRELIAANTIGVLPSSIAIFLAQGSTDNTVPLAITRDYMKRQCTAGSAIRLDVLERVGHLSVARDAAPEAVQWIDDRFHHLPATNDCGR
ncbi:MAG: alpha/beta fold hydrolase [Parvibaculaceae bacterium]